MSVLDNPAASGFNEVFRGPRKVPAMKLIDTGYDSIVRSKLEQIPLVRFSPALFPIVEAR